MPVSILEYLWRAVCAFYFSCIACVLDKKLRVFLEMFRVPCENTSAIVNLDVSCTVYVHFSYIHTSNLFNQ